MFSWQHYIGLTDGTIDTTQQTKPTCTLQTEKQKITVCKTKPVPEEGTLSTSTADIHKNMMKKIPSLRSCNEYKENVSNIASCHPSLSTLNSSVLKEIHSGIKFILRRIVSPIYHIKGLVNLIVKYFKKEVNDSLFSCTLHRVEVNNVFLSLCIKQYIMSTSAFLIGILKRKIDFDLQKKPDANDLVIAACLKEILPYEVRIHSQT